MAHIYLMRRQGISGPVKPQPGAPTPFYPYHALKDTIVIAAVFALLLTLAIRFNTPLAPIADPTDATYVPRPEWYAHEPVRAPEAFPGRLEPVATMVIPGIAIGLLFLLPFLDRRPERAPGKRPIVIGSFALAFIGIGLLTYQGFRTTPSPSSQAIRGKRAAGRAACGPATADGRGRLQERAGAERHHRRRVHGDHGAHVGVARASAATIATQVPACGRGQMGRG